MCIGCGRAKVVCWHTNGTVVNAILEKKGHVLLCAVVVLNTLLVASVYCKCCSCSYPVPGPYHISSLSCCISDSCGCMCTYHVSVLIPH